MVKRTNIPVTVKTRLGWDHDSIRIVEVAERLQDVGCKAIAIHGRTRAQMYKSYGLDGAMIGRASIGNPWFFKQVKHFFKTGQHLAPISLEERVEAASKDVFAAFDEVLEKFAGHQFTE